MPKNAVAAITLVMMGWAGPLFAEPISFLYNIHITERCVGLPGRCGPFSTAFPLTLTFDSDITSELSNPFLGLRGRTYGPPRFSAIPLERPPVAPEALDARFTVETFVPFRHRAGAGEDRYTNEFFNVIWQTRLEAESTASAPPTFSAEGMATLLGQPGSRFLYSYANLIGFEAVGYSGFALLADETAPVPEPGTCILIGSALIGVWYRQRRKSNARE